MGQKNSYDKDEAVSLYLGGMAAARVGKHFGVSGVAILQLLRKRGIERRQEHRIPKLDAETERVLCQRYKAGEPAKVLAPEYGIAVGTVSNVLRRNGHTPRSQSEVSRIYTCNHHFFNNIDSEEKAYWLGFVAADGYISTASRYNSPELRLNLTNVDENHLEKLRRDLGSTHPLRRYDQQGRTYVSFAVRSKELAAGLSQFGVMPRKCHTLQWPELSPSLLRHFLRGYFDGDGYWNIISGYKNGRKMEHWRPNIAFRLTSDRRFLEGCQAYIIQTLGLGKTKLNDRLHKDIYTASTLIYGGRNNASLIFHHMYDDATIWLPRKYEKALPHIN